MPAAALPPHVGQPELPPAYRYEVHWAGAVLGFTSVSGLDCAESADAAELPAGSTGLSGPALPKAPRVSLVHGVYRSSQLFLEWFGGVKMLSTPVTITFLDDAGAPQRSWTLAKAWPVAVAADDPVGDGSRLAIDRIELAHEGILCSEAPAAR